MANVLTILQRGVVETAPVSATHPNPGPIVSYIAPDIEAIARRLTRVLEQLRSAVLAEDLRALNALSTPSGRWEITSLGREQPAPPAGVVACKYCSCTETDACELNPEELAPSEYSAVVEYFGERREPVPEKVGCFWICLEPPVCSNPHCAEMHRATLAAVQS